MENLLFKLFIHFYFYYLIFDCGRYWSLVIKQNNDNANIFRVFGAGFFDDSGDIPNQPVLFFSLSGLWDKRSNTLSLTKMYVSQL